LEEWDFRAVKVIQRRGPVQKKEGLTAKSAIKTERSDDWSGSKEKTETLRRSYRYLGKQNTGGEEKKGEGDFSPEKEERVCCGKYGTKNHISD